MKAIICEMCSSNNVVKIDGLFECQNCGTKYSTEEAKKMMVEVEGAVKIDKSDYVAKSLQNARRARQKEDWEETEKYYNKVEEEEPGNIEAIFYSAYGKAKNSLVDSDIYKREAAFKVLTNCISIVDDNYDVSNESEQLEVIKSIAEDIVNMESSSYVYKLRNNGEDSATTKSLFVKLGAEFAETLLNISRKSKQYSRQYIKMAVDHLAYIYENFPLYTNDKYLLNKLDSIASTCDDKQLKISCWKICFNLASSDDEKVKFQRLCYELDSENFIHPGAVREKLDAARDRRIREQKHQSNVNAAAIVLGVIAGIILLGVWLASM